MTPEVVETHTPQRHINAHNMLHILIFTYTDQIQTRRSNMTHTSTESHVDTIQ